MNVLIQDLLAAAGHVMAAGLNELPEAHRQAVSEAVLNGGWPELRVSILNNAATVRLMLVGWEGQSLELARLDHNAN